MVVTPVMNLPPLPDRPRDGHKGTFGKVLIVAGSAGMSGAAVLSGLGALRGGAGLVYVAVPESIQAIVAGAEPSYLTVPLPCDQAGRIHSSAWKILEPRISEMTSVAIGPGLGRSSELDVLINQVYVAASCPVVVDADALNSLATRELPESTCNGPRVLTPHPGECSRLLGKAIDAIQHDRPSAAIELARSCRGVIVLKGTHSIVCDGRQLYVNSTGNNGMATGGSGDVLTGLIAAILAQGLSPFAAAQLGVYLHGLAGDLAAGELSEPGLIASDLPMYIPAAWRKLSNT